MDEGQLPGCLWTLCSMAVLMTNLKQPSSRDYLDQALRTSIYSICRVHVAKKFDDRTCDMTTVGSLSIDCLLEV